MNRGLDPPPKQTSHLVTPSSRVDPGDLISIRPQPRVGPRGPQKPSGRSQVSDQPAQDGAALYMGHGHGA